MHLLSLEDLDEPHLLLEGLHQLVSLFFQSPVIVYEFFHIASDRLRLALLVHLGLSQLIPRSLQLLKSPVQLRIFCAHILR